MLVLPNYFRIMWKYTQANICIHDFPKPSKQTVPLKRARVGDIN